MLELFKDHYIFFSIMSICVLYIICNFIENIVTEICLTISIRQKTNNSDQICDNVNSNSSNEQKLSDLHDSDVSNVNKN